MAQGKASRIFWGMTAATIGAGVFGLPFALFHAGWGAGVGVVAGLAALVAYAHLLLWRILETVDAQDAHLLFLVHHYLGAREHALAQIAVIGGLLLTLIAYVVLGGQFVSSMTGVPFAVSAAIFWLLAAYSVFLSSRAFSIFEHVGGILLAAMMIGFFVYGVSNGALPRVPVFDAGGMVFVWGIALFALAGWNGAVSFFEYQKEFSVPRSSARRALTAGTLVSAALYLLFVFGVWSFGNPITPDTISGFSGEGVVLMALFALLGIFAIWTSYPPIARELVSSLSDVRIPPRIATALVFCLPILFVYAGFDDFLQIGGLAGGVFLAFQYIAIVRLAHAALPLSRAERYIAYLIAFAFLGGAAIEIVSFLI